MSTNVMWVLHVTVTPLATTLLDRTFADVIMGTKEMEPTVEVSIISEKLAYLIRINFRADKFSRTCSARKLEIFARTYFRAPSDFEISKT